MNKKDKVSVSEAKDGTTIVTSRGDIASAEIRNRINAAVSAYDPENRQYSVFLGDSSAGSLDVDTINTYAKTAQTNVTTALAIMNIVREYINKNDLIGTVYNIIEANVNTDFMVKYRQFPETARNKRKTVEKVRDLIDDFNNQVNIRKLIREVIPMTFAEGTYIMCLRVSDENYYIDHYPLSVVELADYTSNGEPVVLLNMNKLKSALQKTYLKDGKGKVLFMKDIKDEITQNYPKEVMDAYNNNSTYAVIPVRYTMVIRVNNMGRKYGLSPIFKALEPTLVLESFDKADRATSQTRAKKIIHQKLSDKLLGPEGDKDGFEFQAAAHDNLMSAWTGQKTVIVTTPPCVSEIKYVEPSCALTDSDTIAFYRSRVLTALGISFLDVNKSQSGTASTLEMNQLMKFIQKICESLEDAIRHIYYTVLNDNGIDPAFCPEISITPNSLMDLSLRRELSAYMYNTLNCSRATALELVGYNLADEQEKREKENEDGVEDVFYPHGTAFTKSSDFAPVGGNSASSGKSAGNNTKGVDTKNNNESNDDGTGINPDGSTKKGAGRPQGTDPAKEDKKNYDAQRQSDQKQLKNM